MASKKVKVTFNSSPKRYDADMEKAKAALQNAKESGIELGEFVIDGVHIEIQNISGGK